MPRNTVLSSHRFTTASRRVLATLGTVMVSMMVFAPASFAEVEPPEVTTHEIDISVELTAQGQVTVHEEHTWEFASTPPSTLGRQLDRFTQYAPEEWRRLEYANITATSEDTEFTHSVLDDGNTLHVVLTPTTGQLPQRLTAELSYTVEGTLTFARGASENLDQEFFWPIMTTDRFTTTVTTAIDGPRAPRKATCDFAAPETEEDEDEDEESEIPPVTCDVSGNANPTLSLLDAREGTTLAARVTWPQGTFTRLGVNDIDVDSPEDSDTPGEGTEGPEFDPTWTENIDQGLDEGNSWTMVAMIAVIALSVTAGVYLLTRRRPDQRAKDAPLADVAWVREHSGSPITTVMDTPTIPARNTPPHDLTVAVAGALAAKELRAREVTAMLLDLADRGHLTITQNTGSWILTHNPDLEDSTTAAESALLDAIFADAPRAELTSIAEQLAPQFLQVLQEIGQETAQLGLFRQDLEHEALVKAGRKQRTPLGRAYFEELIGFRTYLSDPTPETLTPQVFYRWLPWAVVLGVTEQWAVAADNAGVGFHDPSWFPTRASTYQEFIVALDELAQTSF
ncbi:DUF2207 family protein [Jonesia quinghaiensis]|uniref:DUF2207 family protein n=1 Tax=Jonesia quinghaiensis TaxID=262806 RepID=UPI00040A4A60|nr:DUF2207 domain-containing protein [Jonesia quinghaiensis]